MRKYWLYIENYVFISVRKEKILIYNTLSGKSLEYSTDTEVGELIKRLNLPSNFQIVSISDSDLEKKSIKQFIDDIRNYFMGDIISTDYSKGKPLQMMQKLKIQNELKRLKADIDRSLGENLMNYLSEISLFINSDCLQNCVLCDQEVYKQFLCCTKREAKIELELAKIKDIFKEIDYKSLLNFNILGGDIFRYSEFEELFVFLNSLEINKTIFSQYLNLEINPKKLKNLADHKNLRIFIPVDFPFSEDKLISIADFLNRNSIEHQWMFFILNEKEYEQAENMVLKMMSASSTFLPIYNGNNIEFFKENVFLNQKDFEDAPVSFKDIHIRQEVNEYSFGRLVILPDGAVYGNINLERLGIIGEKPIASMIKKEIERRISWRKVRRYVTPCRSCLYTELCPSISNYNLIAKKYDSCNLKK